MSVNDAVVRQAAAHLLDHPDTDWTARLDLIAAAVRELPATPQRASLWRFLEYATGTPLLRLQTHYVEVFDLRRRQCLHMTFYTDGDTRRRGESLARVQRVYTAAGWRVNDGELPDHLSALLEFTARGDTVQGQRMLVEFQPGLELLRAALRRCDTPYADVIDAVAATLPPADAATHRHSRRLAADGPPAEFVGLDGYAAHGGRSGA